MIKIGLIKEGKTPPDKRVPFSPPQCKTIQHRFNATVVVQSSATRAFTDDEYREAGIAIVDDISDCDVIMGIKEVPLDMLATGKTYLFFSHTFKKQKHNRKLLLALLAKKIRLIDYELLTDESGARLAAFGRYAGIVGAFKALRAWGLLHNVYNLKPAHKCRDRAEMDGELDQVELDRPLKIVLTGKGRVAHGAREVLERAGIQRVAPAAFLTQTFSQSVYTDLSPLEYNCKKDGTPAKAMELSASSSKVGWSKGCETGTTASELRSKLRPLKRSLRSASSSLDEFRNRSKMVSPTVEESSTGMGLKVHAIARRGVRSDCVSDTP